jgi:4-carboxymuconolactone decarboxylase
MLTAMARWAELEAHVRGALNNGVTEEEIAEILLQAGVYAGVPVAAEGFRTALRAVEAWRAAHPKK